MNIKRLLIILVILFVSVSVKSQILEKTLQSIKSHKNISYDDVLKFQFSFQESANVDTSHVQITPIPNENQIGGYFKVKNKLSQQTFDGTKSIELNLTDSTFTIINDPIYDQYSRNILFWNKQISKYLKTPLNKKPARHCNK